MGVGASLQTIVDAGKKELESKTAVPVDLGKAKTDAGFSTGSMFKYFINGKVCRKASKDRDYSRDQSYHLRVHSAIGEANMGFVALHTAEFAALDIVPSVHFTR